MPLPIRLEVFSQAEEPAPAAPIRPEDLEEIRLGAYERGYNAGWDDFARQAETEARDRRAAVERQIEALSFTYHEARGHVLRALEPLLGAIIETVLPQAARAAIVPVVIEQLLSIAAGAAEAPLVLQVSPGSRADFEAALNGLPLPPLEMHETSSIEAGQAVLLLETGQTLIDLAAVAETLRAAVARFYQIQSEESRRA